MRSNSNRAALLRLHLHESVEKDATITVNYAASQERFWLLHDALLNNPEITATQRSELLIGAFWEPIKERGQHA